MSLSIGRSLAGEIETSWDTRESPEAELLRLRSLIDELDDTLAPLMARHYIVAILCGENGGKDEQLSNCLGDLTTWIRIEMLERIDICKKIAVLKQPNQIQSVEREEFVRRRWQKHFAYHNISEHCDDALEAVLAHSRETQKQILEHKLAEHL